MKNIILWRYKDEDTNTTTTTTQSSPKENVPEYLDKIIYGGLLILCYDDDDIYSCNIKWILLVLISSSLGTENKMENKN